MTEENISVSESIRRKDILKGLDLQNVREGLDIYSEVADGKNTLELVDTYVFGEKEQAEFKRTLVEAYREYRLKQQLSERQRS